MYAWDLLTESFNKFVSLLFCNVTSHPAQHIVRDMLQGDIEVFAYVFLLTHHSQQIPREMCGIGVMQSDPLDTLDVGHFLDKFCDMLSTIDVNSIICELLGDDIKLLCALTYKIFHLIEDLIHRPTLMLACYQRNGAVSAMAITAFADLNIGVMLWSSDMALTLAYVEILAIQVLKQLLIVKLTIPAIHLRNLILKFCEVSL